MCVGMEDQELKFDIVVKKRDFSAEEDRHRVNGEVIDGEVEDASFAHPLSLSPGKEEEGSGNDKMKEKEDASEDPLNPLSPDDDPLAGSTKPSVSSSLGASSTPPRSVMATSTVGQMGVFKMFTSAKQSNYSGGYQVKTDEVRGALMFRNFEWDQKKASILEKYTVKDQIQVSFMQDAGQKVEKEDSLENRLDELDLNETDSEQKAQSLSQKEYIKNIEKLHADLVEAWESDQRVKSLKIAIQMAKLLGDSSVPTFYPSKFVVVTEILDTFGKLVFERIRQRAKAFVGLDNAGASAVSAEKSTSKNVSFSQATSFAMDAFGEEEAVKEFFVIQDVANVPPQAKETCRNWFYKIASIRELLPRLYVEMSIMRCYQFLTNENYDAIISRLCAMARGVSDPLVQAYCIAYLCRKGREMAPEKSHFLVSALTDMMYSFRLLNTTQTGLRDSYMKKYDLKLAVWMDLFSPSLDWLTQCLAPVQTKSGFDLIMRKYEDHQEGLVLHHIIQKFKPAYLAPQAFALFQLINKAQVETYPKHLLLAELGEVCCHSPPPKDVRLVLLNEIWAEVRKMQEHPEQYLAIADSWLAFSLKHFSEEEVNVCLADIVGTIKQHEAAIESHEIQILLHSIIKHLLSHYDFVSLCNMESFLPLLDRLKGDSQVEVNKAILKNFSHLSTTVRDPLIINLMFSVGKVVHDSVTSLTSEEDKKEITNLCIAFIRNVEFGRDVEKHLNFFVECRRAFANLDQVKRILVLGVARLVMRTHAIIKGKHNKKTAAFSRACVAYMYITIPMIGGFLERLHLYTLAAQLAVLNQSLHQAEAMISAAIRLSQDIPKQEEINATQINTEVPLLAFAKSLVGVLVVMPGHPDKGPYYLLRELLSAMEDHQWESGSLAMFELRLCAIHLLCAVSQDNIAPKYTIPNIDTNVVLYEADPEFEKETRLFLDELVNKLMDEMAVWKKENQNGKAAEGALRLFDALTHLVQLNGTSVSLAGNLCVLAKKFVDGGEQKLAPYLTNTLESLKDSEDKYCFGLYKKLA
uniref:Uncharacterized protein n=1 Tax=Paramoeba aestuarina TaxID=180227 RepID=A0A7S4USV2_9EUKA